MPAKKVTERVEAKQVLTAVLLADSFTQKFRPITVERPKVLVPLVNVPLLEYTLEWLALNKVDEILVFCCAHAEQIKAHLAASKWSSQRCSPRVQTITFTHCLSMGDALRHIDQKDCVKSDFILVYGDVVANMDLGPALAAHRGRRDKDKNAIMTMVMRPCRNPLQRLRLGEASLLVGTDPATHQLLKLTELEPSGGAPSATPGPYSSSSLKRGGRSSRTCSLDASLFGERDAIALRTDLLDCHIAICAPEVLMLFTDNFDYTNLRRDFVAGVLSEEELGNKVYLYELQGEYAARVNNLRSYDAVSRDILSRWAFPFVPDSNAFPAAGTWGPSSYRYKRGQRYTEPSCTIARGAVLGPCVALGGGSSIGEGASLEHCVVGRGCRIGRGARLTGCYLGDEVVVGEEAVVAGALLCRGVVVKPGATVSPGVVLSYGCVVGHRSTVPPLSHLSLCQPLAGAVSLSDDELEYAAAGGAGGSGRRRRGPVRRRSGLKPGMQQASSSEEEDSGDESDTDSDPAASASSEDLANPALPTPAALAAAAALAAGRAPATGVSFATHLVGEGGAGYLWPPADPGEEAYASLAPPPLRHHLAATFDSEDEEELSGTGRPASASALRAASSPASDDASDASDAGGTHTAGGSFSRGGAEEERKSDPETIFREEVGETFLRCLAERFDQTNVIIELNSLKIAEDRTFADLARYILTTLLALCCPAPVWASREYRRLFASAPPDVSTPGGKLALLRVFAGHLKVWGSLLQRFLKDGDDQVELLLTLEEWCEEEGVFEGAGEGGAAFTGVFTKLLQMLYEGDVVNEEAFLAWAGEKEHADEEERKYLELAKPFLEWLKTADEEEDSSEEED